MSQRSPDSLFGLSKKVNDRGEKKSVLSMKREISGGRQKKPDHRAHKKIAIGKRGKEKGRSASETGKET